MYILVFILIIFLVINRIIREYRKNWSNHLDFSIDFEMDTLIEGDSSTLIQTVINKKLLPLWWADMRFSVPRFIKLKDSSASDYEYFKKDAISALSYEMVIKTLPFTALKRGYYTIKNAELLSSDLFFRYKFIKEFPIFTELYVFPETSAVDKFEVDFRKIVGEIITRKHLIEDPFEFRNIRDYSTNDSLKSVNWNATAKTGELKVNHNNYTSSQDVTILLDLDSYTLQDKKEIREDLIRISAFFTHSLINNGIPVGLVSNGCDSVSGEEIFAPSRNGNNHEKRIFRLFARINIDSVSRPFTKLLDEKIKNNINSHYILISYYSGEDLQMKVNEVAARGLSLQWLLIKDKENRLEIKKPKNMVICERSY